MSFNGERGKGRLKVGGRDSVICGIPFGSWGKLPTGTLSCLLLQWQHLFILVYFTFLRFLPLTYFIVLCTH